MPLIEFYQSEFSGEGIAIGFYCRSSSAEQGFCTVHRCQYNGGIAGMITWCRIVLLIARLVFFVNNDQSQLAEWQENRRPNANNHVVGLVIQYIVPNLHPFRIREFGMIYTQFTSKNTFQSGGKLSGEGNFGHKVEHLF